MIELHLTLQGLLLVLWACTMINLLSAKKSMPLNMFGVMLSAGVLMIYVIVTDMIMKYTGANVRWQRWEWYAVDALVALSFIKVTNMSRKINELLNCFSKKKK